MEDVGATSAARACTSLGGAAIFPVTPNKPAAAAATRPGSVTTITSSDSPAVMTAARSGRGRRCNRATPQPPGTTEGASAVSRARGARSARYQAWKYSREIRYWRRTSRTARAESRPARPIARGRRGFRRPHSRAGASCARARAFSRIAGHRCPSGRNRTRRDLASSAPPCSRRSAARSLSITAPSSRRRRPCGPPVHDDCSEPRVGGDIPHRLYLAFVTARDRRACQSEPIGGAANCAGQRRFVCVLRWFPAPLRRAGFQAPSHREPRAADRWQSSSTRARGQRVRPSSRTSSARARPSADDNAATGWLREFVEHARIDAINRDDLDSQTARHPRERNALAAAGSRGAVITSSVAAPAKSEERGKMWAPKSAAMRTVPC